MPSNPKDATSPPLPCLSIRLGRTKTDTTEDDQRVVIVGRPVEMLKAWIMRAGIAKGPVFRRIDRWGRLQERALTPQSVNLILKRRIAGAGLDPREYLGARAALGLSHRSLRTRENSPRSSRRIG